MAFAVPGNHDWYDSLVAFSQIFCSQLPFCGWDTVQNRSYLRSNFREVGGCSGPICSLDRLSTKPRSEYFTRVMEHVTEDERIILCNAEPYWITEKMYEHDPSYRNRNMSFFEGHVLKGKGRDQHRG